VKLSKPGKASNGNCGGDFDEISSIDWPATQDSFESGVKWSWCTPWLPRGPRKCQDYRVQRPGWIESRGNTVIIGLMHSLKPTGYPRGVPTPPDTPTTCVAFIGAKQWKKVAETTENPEDVLIIEGQTMMNAALPGVAVFATNVNTKLL
jgi:hypothetical protein